MNNKWIFRDGLLQTEWGSFPLAFRSMYNSIIRQQKDGKKKFAEIIKNMVIISPAKDHHGEFRRYDFDAACKMATGQGLLNTDGTLNNREFKKL